MNLKTILAAAFALVASIAQAQVPSDCAITWRSDAAWQGQLLARVGAIGASAPWDAPNYTWMMSVPFTIPSGTIKSAEVVIPTAATGFGDAATATYYLTAVTEYDSDTACAGYGPGPALLKKPTKNTATTFLASTITVPMVTGDLVFPLNAAALAALRAHAGSSFVFGVSMNVPRVTVYPPGEDSKKANQPGGFSFDRISRCPRELNPYCPSLVIH
jgi:hypothetical protein